MRARCRASGGSASKAASRSASSRSSSTTAAISAGSSQWSARGRRTAPGVLSVFWSALRSEYSDRESCEAVSLFASEVSAPSSEAEVVSMVAVAVVVAVVARARSSGPSTTDALAMLSMRAGARRAGADPPMAPASEASLWLLLPPLLHWLLLRETRPPAAAPPALLWSCSAADEEPASLRRSSCSALRPQTVAASWAFSRQWAATRRRARRTSETRMSRLSSSSSSSCMKRTPVMPASMNGDT
mmetsp:Transcript_36988/g.92736  ORF Transcript_36988/g.92736 Transcript_36988/m.92736 type:complete len:244 (+) Transcript_36988:220-951(+)